MHATVNSSVCLFPSFWMTSECLLPHISLLHDSTRGTSASVSAWAGLSSAALHHFLLEFLDRRTLSWQKNWIQLRSDTYTPVLRPKGYILTWIFIAIIWHLIFLSASFFIQQLTRVHIILCMKMHELAEQTLIEFFFCLSFLVTLSKHQATLHQI